MDVVEERFVDVLGEVYLGLVVKDDELMEIVEELDDDDNVMFYWLKMFG